LVAHFSEQSYAHGWAPGLPPAKSGPAITDEVRIKKYIVDVGAVAGAVAAVALR